MARVKIYIYDITEATSIHEEGKGVSLIPWGNDTNYIRGSDDNGRDYVLPDGFETASDTYGHPQIYDKAGEYCELVLRNGKPTLITLDSVVILEPAQ